MKYRGSSGYCFPFVCVKRHKSIAKKLFMAYSIRYKIQQNQVKWVRVKKKFFKHGDLVWNYS